VNDPGCGLKAVIFGFAHGEELSEHTASMPAVLHFLQGEAKRMLGDEPVEAKPGTWVHLTLRLRLRAWRRGSSSLACRFLKVPRLLCRP
jgi:hypothetical protein